MSLVGLLFSVYRSTERNQREENKRNKRGDTKKKIEINKIPEREKKGDKNQLSQRAERFILPDGYNDNAGHQ